MNIKELLESPTDEKIKLFWTEHKAWINQVVFYAAIVPLIILCTMPKSGRVAGQIWILTMLCCTIFRFYPQPFKPLLNSHPKHWPTILRSPEYADYFKYSRPFIYLALALVATPLSPFIMLYYWISQALRKKNDKEKELINTPEVIQFRQNQPKKENISQTTFFHSPAFAITTMLMFLCGIPAAITIGLYFGAGIDAQLGYASRDPRFVQTILIIGFYMCGLGWCLSTLFFRSWFTFPLHFMNPECKVELTEQKLERHPIKGWFLELLCYCSPQYMPVKINWDELERIQVHESGFGRLAPLPDTLFPRESIVYQLLNRMAMLTDATVDRIGREECLWLWNSSPLPIDRRGLPTLALRLWDMSTEDKTRLFYALRRWAPHVVLDRRVQEALVGATTLNDPRYTQIWFNLLTSDQATALEGELLPGAKLKGDEIEIVSRLAAGGQATAYLARKSDGETIVLKEFVLATAAGVDAMIESAGDFENESAILSNLSNPQIVRLLDVFAENHRVYIALEYVKGTSLRARVKEHGPLSEAECIALSLQMCDILIYLHGLTPSMVHRDFTPDNLILDEHGVLKLIDFSVACSSEQRSTNTECVGKHAYTPPEQFRDEASPQSDIYAMGASMYFLLTGHDPIPLSCSDPGGGLSAIVKRATELSLDNRYEAVEWLRSDLLGLAVEEGTAQAAALQETESENEDEGQVISVMSEEKEIIRTRREKSLQGQ
jgi:hypothetical protein